MKTKRTFSGLSGLSLRVFSAVMCVFLSIFAGCSDYIDNEGNIVPPTNKGDGTPERTWTPEQNGDQIKGTDTTTYPESTCNPGAMGEATVKASVQWPNRMYFPEGYIPNPKVDTIKAGGAIFNYKGLNDYKITNPYEYTTYTVMACEEHTVETGWNDHKLPVFDHAMRTFVKEETIDGTIWAIYSYPVTVEDIHVWKHEYNAIFKKNIEIAFPKGKEQNWIDSENSELFINCETHSFKWIYDLISCHCDPSEKKTLHVETKVPYRLDASLSFSGSFNRNEGDNETVLDEENMPTSVKKLEEVWQINDSTKAEMSEKTFNLTFMPNPNGTVVVKFPSKYTQESKGVVVEQEVDPAQLLYSGNNITTTKQSESTSNGTTIETYKVDVTIYGTFYGCPWEVSKSFEISVPKGGDIPTPSDSTFFWKNPKLNCQESPRGLMLNIDRYFSINNKPEELLKKYSILLSRTPKADVESSISKEKVDGYTTNNLVVGSATPVGNWSAYENAISYRNYSISATQTIEGLHTFKAEFKYQTVRSSDSKLNVNVEPTITSNIDQVISADGKTATYTFVAVAEFKYTINGVSEICRDTYTEVLKVNKSGEDDKIDRYEWRNSLIECGTASVDRFAIWTPSGKEELSKTYNATWSYGAKYTPKASIKLANFTLGSVNYVSGSQSFSSTGSWSSGTGIQKRSKSGSFTINYVLGGNSQSMVFNVSAEDLRVVVDNDTHNFSTISSYALSQQQLDVNQDGNNATATYSAVLTVTLSNGTTCSMAIEGNQNFNKDAQDTIIDWLWKNASRSCDMGTIDLYKVWNINGEEFVQTVTLNMPQGANNSYNQTATEISGWNNDNISVTSSSINGATAGNWNGNLQKWTGSVTFNTNIGITITDGFYYNEGRATHSETSKVGYYPTVTGVKVLSSNAYTTSSTNTATGYEVKKVVVDYSLELSYSDGTTCTINGSAASDGKLKTNTPPVDEISYKDDNAFISFSGRDYPGIDWHHGGILFYNIEKNGTEGGWKAIVDADGTIRTWNWNEVLKPSELKGSPVIVRGQPAYVVKIGRDLLYYSALRSNAYTPILTIMQNEPTKYGFLQGHRVAVGAVKEVENGYQMDYWFERTEGHTKKTHNYSIVFPKTFK